jgi:hypothetical protein
MKTALTLTVELAGSFISQIWILRGQLAHTSKLKVKKQRLK